MRKLLILVVVLLAAGAFFGYRYVNAAYTAPGPLNEVTRAEIPPGASVRAAIAQLGKRGVVADPRAVSLYLRLRGLRPNIKAGTYDFPAHASPAQIVQMLEQGNVVLEQLTVVEGSRFADFRHTLESHPAVQ